MSGHRILSSPAVTPEQTVGCFAQNTAAAAAGRRIVAAQDTTECNFPKRQKSKLGPAGCNGDTAGLFIHAMIAVDVADEAVLSMVNAAIWTRAAEPAGDRRKREFVEKASHRWLTATTAAGNVLARASQIIVVGEGESDIYQVFDGRPAGVQLVVRAAQDRKLADDRLFNLAALALAAAVRVIQLVDTRDGSNRPASEVATAAEITAAVALAPTLEGKTERQKNRQPPGPKTMRQDWDRFAAIAQGFALATSAAKNVWIP